MCIWSSRALHEMSQLASIQIYFEPQDPRTCPSVPAPGSWDQSQCPRVPSLIKTPNWYWNCSQKMLTWKFCFSFQIPKYIVNLTDTLFLYFHISYIWSLCHPLNSQPLALVENIKPTFCRRCFVKSEEFAWEEVKLVTPSWWKAANHYQTFSPFSAVPW